MAVRARSTTVKGEEFDRFVTCRLKIRQTIKNSNNEDEVSYISPSAVKDIFKRISPEDARFMGFDYPEIKPEYIDGLTFHYVKTNDEVLKQALI